MKKENQMGDFWDFVGIAILVAAIFGGCTYRRHVERADCKDNGGWWNTKTEECEKKVTCDGTSSEDRR